MHNLAYTFCGFHLDYPEGRLKGQSMILNLLLGLGIGLRRRYSMRRIYTVINSDYGLVGVSARFLPGNNHFISPSHYDY
jgi:hypothetical protein